MWRRWGASLAAVLVLSACSLVSKKPIEVDMPTTQKHFIVMGPGGHVVDAPTTPPEEHWALRVTPIEAP